jgi:NLI interacting factor-like phosphatase
MLSSHTKRRHLFPTAIKILDQQAKNILSVRISPNEMSSGNSTPTPSDLAIFLDLDGTLISTTWTKDGIIEGVRETAITSNATAGRCTYKRPFLDLFLHEVSTRFGQVHVFTASNQVYADPILDKLDPNGTIFTKRWYRESCQQVTGGQWYEGWRKNVLALDCSPLKIDPKRFVLVDDRQDFMMDHLSNGILVSAFKVSESSEERDTTLVKVLELLKQLDGVEDVRPLLDEKFLSHLIKKEMADLHVYQRANPI